MNKRCNVSDRKNPTCEDNTWGEKYRCIWWIKDLNHTGQLVCTYSAPYPYLWRIRGVELISCNCASAISAAIEQEDTND